MSRTNFLIVEDDPDWCDAYSRAAAKEGITKVWSADNLADAAKLIDNMRFAVAFVDIGLSVKNDGNIDGLRVMEKIRDAGDQTSIVVITGRSGRDVLPITRDAIMKYRVHEITSKPIEPKYLRQLVRSGLDAYSTTTPPAPSAARDALRGSTPEWEWDDRMLRETRAQDGISGFYRFLNRLVGEFLPLIPPKSGEAVGQDPATKVMYGRYWSRSIGRPVVVIFGEDGQVEPGVEALRKGQPLLGVYSIGKPLSDVSGNGLRGAVFVLADAQRGDFAPV